MNEEAYTKNPNTEHFGYTQSLKVHRPSKAEIKAFEQQANWVISNLRHDSQNVNYRGPRGEEAEKLLEAMEKEKTEIVAILRERNITRKNVRPRWDGKKYTYDYS